MREPNARKNSLKCSKMHDNHETQKINQTSVMPEKTGVYWNSRFSIAPMLDWTDRHCRYFLRLLSRNTLLYTEMVTTGGDYSR